MKYRETVICDWLFFNPQTLSPYKGTRVIINYKFKPMLKRLNIGYISLYSLRHIFITLAIQKGVSLATVSKCLGHTGTEVIQKHYLRLGNSNQADVREELESLTA